MNVLVVDVGGTHVKLLATGQSEPRKFVSGPTLTAEQMVAGVKEFARAGIDVRALAARLQDDGAKSFVKSWEELLKVIASKSEALKRAG